MEICARMTSTPVQGVEIIRNPLLLERISKHLPHEALVQLRGTCVEWNRAFLPQLKHRHIPLSDPSQARPPDQILNEFTQVLKASHDIPFSNYKIDWPEFDSPTHHTLVDFLIQFGVTIKSLDCRGGMDWLLGNILYEWVRELQDLTLVPYEVSSPSGAQETPAPPKPLPKLRRLEYFYGDAPSPTQLCKIVEQAVELEMLDIKWCWYEYTFGSTIRALQDINCVHKLKALTSIPLRSERETIQSLITLVDIANTSQLRLERFGVLVYLQPSESELNATVLHLLNSFWKTQATCLREMEIELTPTGVAVQIPKLETLSSFSLNSNLISIEDPGGLGIFENATLQFEERTMGATFPNLKRLEYTNQGRGRDSRCEEAASQLSHEGVTELAWNSVLNLNALRASFPGVTQVEITMNETDLDGLGLLWNSWPALKSLHIKYEPYVRYGDHPIDLDELLSGIRGPELEKLKHAPEYAKVDSSLITMDTLRGLQRTCKTWYGIGDHKHLQKLTVEVEYYENVAFSDIGGYFGLAFAPQSLQFQLKLGWAPARRREEPWLSSECLNFIRASLGPFAVINL